MTTCQKCLRWSDLYQVSVEFPPFLSVQMLSESRLKQVEARADTHLQWNAGGGLTEGFLPFFFFFLPLWMNTWQCHIKHIRYDRQTLPQWDPSLNKRFLQLTLVLLEQIQPSLLWSHATCESHMASLARWAEWKSQVGGSSANVCVRVCMSEDLIGVLWL